MKKTLLLLTPQGISAWQWHAGVFSAPARFSADGTGPHSFTEYLDRHRHPIWLLADLAEESFLYEVLPHINDFDHTHLVQRRLQEYYSDTPLRMVIRQFRHPQIGKDDEILYSALARPERLSPWLDTIQQRHCLIAAIHSIPHLSAQLLPNDVDEHLLLISSLESSNIRSSYFHKRRLRYSRLDVQGNLATTLGECIQMREFLRQRRLLPHDATLRVAVLCSQDDWKSLQSSLTTNLTINHLDISTTATALSCPVAPQGSDATPLFMQLLATRPPERHYAPDELTRRFRQRKLRQALYSLGGLVAFSGIAWAGASLWQAGQLDSDSLSLTQQVHALESSALKSRPSTLPAPETTILASIQTLQTLDSPTLESWLEPLADSLDRHPAIHIEKLDWQAADENGKIRPTLLIQLSQDPENTEQLASLRQDLTSQGYQVMSLEAVEHSRAHWQVRKESPE